MAITPSLGHAFGMALCEHFGLPPDQVLRVTPHADRDESMHAKMEIALTADDLAGIAMRMGSAGVTLERLPVVEQGGQGF